MTDPNQNIVIACLARGYTDYRRYSRLIVRNQSIYEAINFKRKEAGLKELPLVIFHAGNIDEAAQKHILRNEKNASVVFADATPAFLLNAQYDGNIDYHLTCRFYAYWIWEYCRNFDFIIRIDEDIYLRRFPHAITHLPNNIVAMKSTGYRESHEPTNSTLPQAIETLTGMNSVLFYRDNFPYTNVFISSVPFWRSSPLNSVLEQICLSDNQIAYRWGDLPILGSLLNIYAPTQVATIPDLDYFNLSHDCTRICNGRSSRG